MSITLTTADLDSLSRCWITPDLAERAGVFRVDSQAGALVVGRNGNHDYCGLSFPYTWPGETHPRAYRLRLDNPPLESKGGDVVPGHRYLSAPGARNMLYFGPGSTPEDLADVSLPVVVCEGEKKTLALARLAEHGMAEGARRFLPIGLAGVWAWRGVVGKGPGPTSERQDIRGVIPDLGRITWQGRKIIILFDSNVTTQSSVQAARRELSKELASRGAEVLHVDLQPEAGVNGIDDYLGKHGPQAGLELIEAARAFNREFHCTELGHAERLVFEHGQDLRYIAGMGWHAWDGRRWGFDRTGEVQRRAKAVARLYLRDAATCPNEDKRKALAKFALAAERGPHLANVVTLARTEREIAAVPESFDADDFALNVLNGTIDLKTGKFRPHSRQDQITKLAPVAYDPAATCPTWLTFLDRIFDKDEGLTQFVQRAVGYSLTGSTDEQVWFILWGSGSNGKSTLVRSIAGMLGDYATRTPTETLLMKRGDGGIPNDLARLRGCRFVHAAEVEDNRRLAESRLKDLSGGDSISARFLHREWFEFTPKFKLALSTNHKPIIKGQDHATWRRIRLIPFRVQIPDEQQDKGLPDKLKDEYSGILNWALEGCRQWRESGLGTADAVTAATAGYRQESDLVAAFLAECSERESQESQTPAGELYEIYRFWCKENGEKWESSRRFGLWLTERGIERGKDGATRRTTYRGLSVTNDVRKRYEQAKEQAGAKP